MFIPFIFSNTSVLLCLLSHVLVPYLSNILLFVCVCMAISRPPAWSSNPLMSGACTWPEVSLKNSHSPIKNIITPGKHPPTNHCSVAPSSWAHFSSRFMFCISKFFCNAFISIWLSKNVIGDFFSGISISFWIGFLSSFFCGHIQRSKTFFCAQAYSPWTQTSLCSG